MGPRLFMGAARAAGVVEAVESAGARVWVDGGWGVEALLGDAPRVHADLDLVVELSSLGPVLAALGRLGYALEEDHRPTRAVLVHRVLGTAVDLHPVVFAPDGSALQLGARAGGGDALYPADGFARGTIAGREVGCLTAGLALAHHCGYDPDAVDVSDMARLCRRFSLPWPAGYPPLHPEDADRPAELPTASPGRVVRVGGTVRRPVGPWSPDVHALLGHLRRNRFGAAPEVLGIDEQGREVLGWVDGDSGWAADPAEGSSADGGPSGRLHPGLAGAGALVAVGRRLARLHRAAEGLVGTPGEEARRFAGPRPPGSPAPGPEERVVGHGDVAPWNLVMRAGEVAALVDWDLAGPTTAVWELAGAAWGLVPLYAGGVGGPLAQPAELRLRDLADGYGLGPAGRRLLVPTVIERMQSLVATIRLWGSEGIGQWAELLETGHDRLEDHTEALAVAAPRLSAALLD